MDQAMGDVQAQLDEVKRMWEEERRAREKAETELKAIKGVLEKRLTPPKDKDKDGKKRAAAERAEGSKEGAAKAPDSEGSKERVAKKQKVAS